MLIGKCMKKSYKKVKYAVKHLQSFLFHLSGLESNILKHNILMIFNFIIHFLCLNEANVLWYYIHSTIYTWFFELQIPYAFYFFLSLKKPLDWTYNCQVLLYSRVCTKEYILVSEWTHWTASHCVFQTFVSPNLSLLCLQYTPTT